jgi:hypothetical protein
VRRFILERKKYQVAAERSYAIIFMMGATNDNLEEVLKQIQKNVAGIKIFWDLLRVTCSLIMKLL